MTEIYSIVSPPCLVISSFHPQPSIPLFPYVSTWRERRITTPPLTLPPPGWHLFGYYHHHHHSPIFHHFPHLPAPPQFVWEGEGRLETETQVPSGWGLHSDHRSCPPPSSPPSPFLPSSFRSTPLSRLPGDLVCWGR